MNVVWPWESVVMGMAHRGRLNILNNVFGKPLGVICTEMKSEGRSSFNVGDVRLGDRRNLIFRSTQFL